MQKILIPVFVQIHIVDTIISDTDEYFSWSNFLLSDTFWLTAVIAEYLSNLFHWAFLFLLVLLF